MKNRPDRGAEPRASPPALARRFWPATETRRIWLGAAVIAVAAGAAYANSLSTPFLFDDLPGVVNNPTIRSLWPPWLPLLPRGGGSGVVGRPIVNLTFAINYALGGTRPLGYHLLNLFIHVGAALALFGTVRRTLGLARLPEWLRTSALPLAFATAMLWVLHPLQTEAVTFVTQRTEALGGLVYLLALYCFIRGTDPAARTPRRWLALSVAACFTGMATKEILVSAPLILLLYDRTFIAGTFAAALRQRRAFHALTALSWILLAGLMWQSHGRGGTVELSHGISAWTSLLSQCDALTTYLKLALWPHPLVFDYGDYLTNAVTHLRDALPQAALLAALAAATVYALVRRPELGFVGAWFFLILAPSSSVVPLLTQMKAEHRMYLSLAGIVVLAVILIQRVAGRAAPAVFAALAVALGATTVARNHDYRTALAMWADVAQKRPGDARAHFNLGLELARTGDKADALREYEEAARLDPGHLDTQMSLAALLLDDRRINEALPHIAAAVRLGPKTATANNNLGHLLFLAGDPAGAVRYLEAAVRLDPVDADAHNNLGSLLLEQGSYAEAIAHFRRAIALRPDLVAAHTNLGDALLRTGQIVEARASLEEAVRLNPDYAEAQLGLGNVLAMAGQYAEALPHFQKAVQADPANIGAHFNLGLTLRALNRTAEAIGSFQTVLRLDPHDSAAIQILGELRGDALTPTDKTKNGRP